ncbi:type II toxin-antitoxin system VapC family toxin [Pontiellaceae bacterium B1224]|nr:type II toxin-antitoxin system VapC family toxin [Pontiellaceae bacterium B1224]
MKLLLDTHVLLWALMEPSKLSTKAKVALLDPENECFISAISLWEISMKHALGKLELSGVKPEELIAKIKQMGMDLMALSPITAVGFHNIPRKHGDPFDRMLIHQAISDDFYLVSADRVFPEYEELGLKLIW